LSFMMVILLALIICHDRPGTQSDTNLIKP